MIHRKTLAIAAAVLALTAEHAPAQQAYSWRYYRPGNTGIQGDYNQAIYIGPDNDPWIGGYDPGFEEGGVAKLIEAENRWINVSNIDFPVIGHPDLTGTTRVSDIVADANGVLWMATWSSALKMDPDVGGPSIVNFASASPPLANGGARDIDIAPDGTIWFSLIGYGGYQGGVVRHTPGTSDWHYWTGGSVPQGGNNWPQLVWNVASVSIQPKPGGGYTVWADSDNSSTCLAVRTYGSPTPTASPPSWRAVRLVERLRGLDPVLPDVRLHLDVLSLRGKGFPPGQTGSCRGGAILRMMNEFAALERLCAKHGAIAAYLFGSRAEAGAARLRGDAVEPWMYDRSSTNRTPIHQERYCNEDRHQRIRFHGTGVGEVFR